MARNIFTVNATQVVTSESHPEGIKSVVSGFPKDYDSASSSEEQALDAAKSAYFAQLSANYANSNPARVMMTVTLEMANGRQLMHDCKGAFPAPAPAEPEEPGEQEEPGET